MADEGSTQLMAELVMMEKEEEAKLAQVQAQLDVQEPRLAKARELLVKAKANYDQVKALIEPLQSDKILIEGELEALAQKKSDCRVQARRVEVGGIRPGTAEFVERMNEVAGDPEVAKAKEAAKALHVEAELAALKAKLGGGDA